MDNVVAIIPAAGSGKRMQQGINKQFLEVGEQTVLERTLRAFQTAKHVTRIVVVTKKTEINMVRKIVDKCDFDKVKAVVEGGAERQDSIFEGLRQTVEEDKWVLVHDGARPFITSEMIDGMIEDLIQRNEKVSDENKESLIMAVPSKDTIKRVSEGCVAETLKRAELWNVQTPQAFERNLLISAYAAAKLEGFNGTDDASLVEWQGRKVFVYEGSYENIKITTPDDLYLGEAILKKRGDI